MAKIVVTADFKMCVGDAIYPTAFHAGDEPQDVPDDVAAFALAHNMGRAPKDKKAAK